jgi:hypothetical protein
VSRRRDISQLLTPSGLSHVRSPSALSGRRSRPAASDHESTELYSPQQRPLGLQHQRSPSSGGVWTMQSRSLTPLPRDSTPPPSGEILMHIEVHEQTTPPSAPTVGTSSSDEHVDVISTNALAPHCEENDRRPDSAH